MGVFSRESTTTNGAATTTLIAAHSDIEGSFNIDGGLHIDGKVRGDIHCTGTVTIGKNGHVDGEISSKKLLISGNFTGTCHASLVQILPGGQLDGTIYSGQLVIEPGGNFYGDSHSLDDNKSALSLVHDAEQTASQQDEHSEARQKTS